MKITKGNFVFLICFIFSLIGIFSLFKSFNEIDNEFQSKNYLFKERLKLFSFLIFFSFSGISYYLITKNKFNNSNKMIGVILGCLAFVFNGFVLFFYPEMFSKGTLLMKKVTALVSIILFGIGLIFGIYKLLIIKKPRNN